MGNEKIVQEVLDRMVPKKKRYVTLKTSYLAELIDKFITEIDEIKKEAMACPKCGTFVAPDPEEHAWGYMDYHCESCNYQWSIRRSRDA